MKKSYQAVHFVYKSLYHADLEGCVIDSSTSVPSVDNNGDYCLGIGIDANIVNRCFSETSQKKSPWDHISAFLWRLWN